MFLFRIYIHVVNVRPTTLCQVLGVNAVQTCGCCNELLNSKITLMLFFKITIPLRGFFSAAGIVFLLLGAVSCGRTYREEEADRSMKVLNSDWVNFFSQASEKPEMKAIAFLWDQSSAPLPFPQEKFTVGKAYQPYDFEASKGIYVWDEQTFVRQADTSLVIFRFEPDTGGVYRSAFILSDFSVAPVGSRPDFPVEMAAMLQVNGAGPLTINHQATVEEHLPLHITTELRGPDYDLKLKLNRTREQDAGTLRFTLRMDAGSQEIFSFDLDAAIGYSRQGYFFNQIYFDSRMFRHSVTGKIDYAQIDPTGADYAGSFNRHSQITLFEGRHKVGDIVLAKTADGELLDYFIRFSSGEEKLLSDYLPFLKKILNLKY